MGDTASLRLGQVFVTAPVPLDHPYQATINPVAGERVELGAQVPHAVSGIKPHRRRPVGPQPSPPLSLGLAAPRGLRSAHRTSCLVCCLGLGVGAQLAAHFGGHLGCGDRGGLINVDFSARQSISHLRRFCSDTASRSTRRAAAPLNAVALASVSATDASPRRTCSRRRAASAASALRAPSSTFSARWTCCADHTKIPVAGSAHRLAAHQRTSWNNGATMASTESRTSPVSQRCANPARSSDRHTLRTGRRDDRWLPTGSSRVLEDIASTVEGGCDKRSSPALRQPQTPITPVQNVIMSSTNNGASSGLPPIWAPRTAYPALKA